MLKKGDNMQLIETIDVCKSFKNKKVIDKINLSVEPGDIYGFLGQNGAGKTTTIRMVLGLIRPDSGTINLCGYNIKNNLKEALSNVGAIVETPTFHTYMSAYENLKLTARLFPNINENRIMEVLDIVGLKSRLRDKVKVYSLGMKQRLGIARALLCNPKLMVLDEPTNGLDPQGMKEIRDLITNLSKDKSINFFVSSHLLHEIEQICNKVGIIKEGNLVVQGNVRELLNTDYERIEIIVQDRKSTINVLKQASFVKEIKDSGKNIEVIISKGEKINLNQYLVSKNIIIEQLLVRENSLEEYFFKLTGGV